MSDWKPSLYLKFDRERTQPALDLALRAKELISNPKRIADLGCGPGNSTRVLSRVFPGSGITGLDSSPDMIKRAKSENPDIEFRLCDARSVEGGCDLIFSNACLQWIERHDELIPMLISRLNPGGVLAVQVPNNSEEPFFKLIEEAAAEKRWGLSDVSEDRRNGGVLSPMEYYDILAGVSSGFDIWEAKYYHTLSDHSALAEWARGTRLRPYLERLDGDSADEFIEELTLRSRELYPPKRDGSVVLCFRRLFFTAVK